MWGTNGVSRYAMPFRVIPERGQVSENVAQPSIKQRCGVFHDDKSGSNFANNSGVLFPKSTVNAVQSGAGTDLGNVLAGETAANSVNGNSICPQTVGGELAHVAIASDCRPLFSEDTATVRVGFAKRDGFMSC